MNIGKVFEEQFKKSVPDYALLYRLPDAAQSFGRNNNLRFSRKNPFDYILWDSKKRILYALELKTVKGKSITFDRDGKNAGKIHSHQIDGLNSWNKYNGIVCGFVIEFREIEKTIFLGIEQMNRVIETIPKKSFSFDDLDKYHIQYAIIEQRKARTRYTYDIDHFLNQNNERYSNAENC